jgi:soluble lytic murein transglycosylase
MVAAPCAVLAAPCDAIDPTPLYRANLEFAKARSAFQSGRIDESLALLELWRDSTGGRRGDVTDWLAGRWLSEAGRLDEAIDRLSAVSGSPLDDDARFREGRLYLDAGNLAQARDAFARISPASRHWARARLALSEALVREGRSGAAHVVLADLLRDDLPADQRNDAVLAMIRALAAAGDVDGAMRLSRSAWLKASASYLPDMTRQRTQLGSSPSILDGHLRTLLKGDSRDVLRLAGWTRTHRKAADALDPGLHDLCQGMVLQADPRNRDATLAALERAGTLAVDVTLGAVAVYESGDTLVNTGDDQGAGMRFMATLQRDPGGPMAADAAISAARCAARTGQPGKAVAVLDQLGAIDPPTVSEAALQWEIALAWMLAGNTAEALIALDAAARRLGRGTGLPYGAAEKVMYFRGILLQSSGHAVEGLADLRRVARNDPHTWYGMLARSRLAELGEVTRTPPYRDPSCATAQGPAWLWRLGYRDEARAEMSARAAAGILDEASSRILALLLADPSTGEGRARSRDYLRGPRGEGDESLVDAAYPRQFLDEVMAAVAETDMDPALVFGVIRVESGFHPKARSPKGAIGLMQVMPSTAQRVATLVLRDRHLAGGLWRPSNNVRLGTTYLNELSRHFRGHLPLILAGYHAGPAAARRFLKTLGHLSTDLFVEALPYQATSAYVKRVVSYATGYRALLDDGTRGPVTLEPHPPTSLGPFMEPHRPEPRACDFGSSRSPITMR